MIASENTNRSGSDGPFAPTVRASSRYGRSRRSSRRASAPAGASFQAISPVSDGSIAYWSRAPVGAAMRKVAVKRPSPAGASESVEPEEDETGATTERGLLAQPATRRTA